LLAGCWKEGTGTGRHSPKDELSFTVRKDESKNERESLFTVGERKEIVVQPEQSVSTPYESLGARQDYY